MVGVFLEIEVRDSESVYMLVRMLWAGGMPAIEESIALFCGFGWEL